MTSIVRLGSICDISTGQSAPQDAGAFTADGQPFIRAGSLDHLVNGGAESALEKINEDNASRYRMRLFPKGTIVFAKSGMSATLGRVYRLQDSCYVVSHLATVIPSDQVDGDYLLNWLKANPPSRLISNEAYPSIKTSEVQAIGLVLPSLVVQRRITATLDKADAICNKRHEALKLANDFLRSVFLDMFGDPVTNSNGWDDLPIRKIATITTGNTPSRQVLDYFGDHIEWIKSDNINTSNHHLTKATEGLSQLGLQVGRSAPAGSTLVTCIAGSPACIGNAALSDRPVAFNQQINALTPKPGIEPEFLYAVTLFSKLRIQAASTKGMKGMVSKGALEQVHFILPTKPERQAFVRIFEKVLSMLRKMHLASDEADHLFKSLQQQAFS